MTILGIELLLVGGACSLTAAEVAPRVVLAVYTLIAVLAMVLRVSSWRLPNDVAALCLSFLSALPGALFYWQFVNRDDRPWEHLPLVGFSTLWTLVGPVLLFASTWVSPWRISPRALRVLQVLHLVIWFLGLRYSWMCTMAV